MAAPSRLQGDIYVAGNLSSTTFTPPAGSISDEAIESNAQIDASKITRHQSIDVELYPEGTTVVALASKLIHIVQGTTGTLVAFQGIVTTVATGADRTIDVDLQKSTSAGSFATVLTTKIHFTNGSVIRTPVSAVINTASLVAGDVLRVVVTVAGSASAQAAGLFATLTFEEAYS